jgi:glutamyl-tRNA reductase
LEPALLVIGLNHHTAPAEICGRFAMDAARRAAALRDLSQSDGVEEILALSTEDHNEFILWASDPALAANSVLQLLSKQYELKLCEWRHFFRLLDEEALVHCFRVASGLESLSGNAPIRAQFEEAWRQAQQAGTAGRYLDSVMRQALTVAKRIQGEVSADVTTQPAAAASAATESAACNLVAMEAHEFRRALDAEHLVPAVAALRTRLENTCRQEIDSFEQEAGPFPHEQRELLAAIAPRIAQRIAGTLVRELKGDQHLATSGEGALNERTKSQAS